MLKRHTHTMVMENQVKTPRPYKDLVFRLVISFPVAVYMVIYREEESFFEAIFDSGFWIGTVFSYGVSILLLWMLNRIAYRLDAKYDWQEATLLRILYQVVCGLVIPAILAFLLATLFFAVFGIKILETTYLSDDFPLVVLLLILGNLYYLTYYLWRENHALQAAGQKETAGQAKVASHAEPAQGKVFMAKTEKGTVPIQQEKIAAVFRQEEYVLLRTFNRETHVIQQSVKEAWQALNTVDFFRINPRFIIHKGICQAFRHAQYGKLEVELGPPMNLNEVVSRGNAQAFEDWVKV